MLDKAKRLFATVFFVLVAMFYAAIFLFLVNSYPAVALLILIALAVYINVRKEGLTHALILGRLNTKLRRLGFVIFYAGLLLMLAGMASENADIDDLLSATMLNSYRYERYYISATGAHIALAGFFMAFLYEKTIKPLISWITAPNP